MVKWLDHASRDSVTRLLLVYIIIYTIPATGLYHVVVTACDALYLVFQGGASLFVVFVDFWLPVLLGNTLGGVLLVAVVNYAKTSQRRFSEKTRAPKLSLREWLFGWHVGRPRVPVSKDDTDVKTK
ncbi:formate/nitrite transporter family protein [Haladaptatus sp. NG-SE-30]